MPVEKYVRTALDVDSCEAIQFDGSKECAGEIVALLGLNDPEVVYHWKQTGEQPVVRVLVLRERATGPVRVELGQWVRRTPSGEVGVVENDVFTEFYSKSEAGPLRADLVRAKIADKMSWVTGGVSMTCLADQLLNELLGATADLERLKTDVSHAGMSTARLRANIHVKSTGPAAQLIIALCEKLEEAQGALLASDVLRKQWHLMTVFDADGEQPEQKLYVDRVDKPGKLDGGFPESVVLRLEGDGGAKKNTLGYTPGRYSISSMAKDAHSNSLDKGWWEEIENDEQTMDQVIPTKLCLIHEEVSEALSCHRKGEELLWEGEGGKPEGIASELADVVIRVGDLAEAIGVDLERSIQVKMRFNKTRPHRHGGRKC